jgi:electron transport complex protein RnfG
MKKMSFKEFFMPGIILFFICLVSTLLLAYTNQITAPKIRALADKNAEAAFQLVLNSAKSFSGPLDVKLDGVSYTYYKGLAADGKTAGYVFTTDTQGYGGDVKIMSGIDAKGVVTGVHILQITETPGLGMKARNDSFLKQFLGKSGIISLVKTSAGKNQIQAMTGATITSSAVTGGVNIALSLYNAVNGKTEPTTQGGLSADDTARKLLLPAASSFTGPADISLNGTNYAYYTGVGSDGKTAGYIFTTGSWGFESNLKIMTGVDTKGVITGVNLLEINDSPGLGMNAKNPDFLSQYIGMSGKISVTTGTAGKDTIQAITGATITSTGVTNAVNIALDLYKSVAGGK